MPVAIDRKKIPLKDVVITERQRKTMDDEHIERLANSIKVLGLIHPITLERGTNELIAGFSRYLAVNKLGWDEIDYMYQDEMDDLSKKRMELEENLQRKDLEWWEKDAALAEIHTLMGEIKEMEGEEDEGPGGKKAWSIQDTSSLTGKGVGSVHRALEITQAIMENPELAKEKSQSSALRKLKTAKQINERKKQIERKKKGKTPTVPAEIKEGDALELIKAEPDKEYDAIVTNFPFGIDYQTKGGKEVYHDEETYITDLVRGVVEEGFRVLKDDSWFVAWFDIRKITYSNHQVQLHRDYIALLDRIRKQPDALTQDEYNECIQLAERSMGLAWWLKQAGFSYVTLVPPIWVKPNKTQGMVGDPRKGFIVAYEAMVFAAKGDAMLMKQGLQNIFIYDTLTPSERDFEMQMPIDLCSRIVELVSLGGGKILDPFAGSGSIGEGALDKFCAFTGFELNPERAELGNMRLQEHHFAQVKAKEAEEAEDGEDS